MCHTSSNGLKDKYILKPFSKSNPNDDQRLLPATLKENGSLDWGELAAELYRGTFHGQDVQDGLQIFMFVVNLFI
jgi:hypothetical protein